MSPTSAAAGRVAVAEGRAVARAASAMRWSAIAAYACPRGLPPSTSVVLSGGVRPDASTAPTAATSAVSAVAHGLLDVVGGGVVEPPLPLLPLPLLLVLPPPQAARTIDPKTASAIARRRAMRHRRQNVTRAPSRTISGFMISRIWLKPVGPVRRMS